MSNLASPTERAAILVLAKCLRHFDQLTGLNMTADDAFTSRAAENQLRSIIESNGYEVDYIPGRGTIIKKPRPPRPVGNRPQHPFNAPKR